MCKLLTEPTSHVAAERDRIEVARDFVEVNERIWPFLSVTDEYAANHAAARAIEELSSDFGEEDITAFSFVILQVDYAFEIVELSMAAPIEVIDTLQMLLDTRDQVQRRLFPF